MKRAEFLFDGPSAIGPIVHRPLSLVNQSLEDLLTSYNIPFASIRLARDLYEAKTIAEELGYPVDLKIASPDILHKSDVGGVVADIADATSLENAYTQIVRRSEKPGPMHKSRESASSGTSRRDRKSSPARCAIRSLGRC